MRRTLDSRHYRDMSKAKQIVIDSLFGNRQMDADIRRSIERADADERRWMDDAANGGSKRTGERKLAWNGDFHGAQVGKSSPDFSN